MALLCQENLASLPGMALGRMAYEEKKPEEDTFPSLGAHVTTRLPRAHDMFIEEIRSQVTSVPTDLLILVALLQLETIS